MINKKEIEIQKEIENKTTLEYEEWYSELHSCQNGLYWYYVNLGGTSEMKAVYSYAPTIQSIIYNPFLKYDTIADYTDLIPFDTNYFGNPNGAGGKIPAVLRFKNNMPSFFYGNLGGLVQLRDSKPNTVGKDQPRNWKNESKLQIYPYSKWEVTDYINAPLEIYPQYGPINGQFKWKSTVGNKTNYLLYLEGYKGDTVGNIEGAVNQVTLDLPILSSAYSQYLASSKNSDIQGYQNTIAQSNLNRNKGRVDSGISAVSNVVSMFTGNIAGGITGIAKTGSNAYYNEKQSNMTKDQAKNVLEAKALDLQTQPRTVQNATTDTVFNFAKSQKRIDAIKYTLSDEINNIIGNYFAMYGYSQNNLMNINIRNRYYYNFIKTAGINISAVGVPRLYMQEIKSIFDAGVTVWHIDRAGVKVCDYSKDNAEV